MIPGKLTISRVHSNQEPDYIEVRLRDEASAIEFVTAKLSLADFANAVTGLSHVGCELDTRGLENVGKILETDTLEFPMPKNDFSNRNEVAVEAAKAVCPLGWVPDHGFNSQGSFFQRGGKLWARTTIRRWVAKE